MKLQFESETEQLLHDLEDGEITDIRTDHKTNVFIEECCHNFPIIERETEQLLQCVLARLVSQNSIKTTKGNQFLIYWFYF